MNAPCLTAKAQAIDAWRKRPVYRAKVVKSEPTEIVVMSTCTLAVGARISFAVLGDLKVLNRNQIPSVETWRSAVIWRIDKEYLHLTRT